LRAGLAGRLLMLAALAAAAWAQAPYFEAPILGYALDPASGSVRPILGVPGAARFEAPLRSEGELRPAALAPGRNYGLATSEEGLRILTWRDGVVRSAAFDGPAARFDRIVFSPDGLAVALETGSMLEIWNGMPDSPALVRRIAQTGGADALALSDDGQSVAWAIGGRVVLSVAGRANVVAEGGRISSLAFSRASCDLAIADEERGQILLVSATGAVSVLTRDIENPSNVAFSGDGRKLAVAAKSAVAVIDLASREVATLACDCGVDALVRVRGNAVFRLTEPAKGRAPLLDGDGAEPRIVFIAAGEESK